MRIKTPILLVLACLLVVGCGGDDKGDGKGGGGGGGNGKGVFGGPASVAGTWVLDVEAVKPKFMEMAMGQVEGMLESLPEEQKTEMLNRMKQQVDQQMGMMSFEVNLNADGSFTVSGQTGPMAMDVKGTWKQEGDKVMVTTTEEDGVKKDPPETVTATLKDGKIHIKPEEEMPFALVLKRK